MAKEKIQKPEEKTDSQQARMQAVLDKNGHFNDIEPQSYEISTGSLKFDLQLGGGLHNTIVRCAGPAEAGKAQPIDSKVMTPYGWKSIGDLKQSCLVIGSDGKAKQVLNIFPQGIKKINKVIFEDYTEVYCCDEHLWLTRNQNDRERNKKGSVKTTGFLKQTLKIGDHKNHSIPYVKAVEFKTQNEKLPIDPYVLGLLLGDGSFRRKNEVSYTTADQQLLNEIDKRLKFSDKRIKKIGKTRRYEYYIYSPKLRNTLTEMGLWGKLSYDKFIPETYLYSSILNRKKILQGLMDTDGNNTRPDKNSGAEFSSTSIKLAEQVVFLVRSLGGRATYKSRITSFTHKGIKKKGHISYRVRMSFSNFCPFILERKKNLYQNRIFESEKLIVDIQPAGEKECVCIQVDSPDNLYLTEGFNLTHNTSFSLNVAKIFLSEKNRRGVYFLSDKDLSENLLERCGVKFVDKLEDWEDGTCYIIRTREYETVCNTIKGLIGSGGKYFTDKQYIFVLDSMDNFAPRAAFDVDFGESSQKGGITAITSHFFKCFNILLPRLGHTTIMISQFRDTVQIGKQQAAWKQMKTSGGRSLEHAASWAFEFLPVQNGQIDMFWDGEMYKSKKIGHNCIIRLQKTTNETTGETVRYPIIYGREAGNSIWVEKELYDLGLFYQMLKSKGSWIEFDSSVLKEIREINPDFPEKIQGEDKCVKLFEANPKVSQFLYTKIKKLVAGATSNEAL